MKVVVPQMNQGITLVTTTELPCLDAMEKGVTEWQSKCKKWDERRYNMQRFTLVSQQLQLKELLLS